MDERLVRRSAPFPLYDVVLGDASAPQLAQLSERMGLALSVDEMRRIQSHNHPSAIEPYGGANTGIGGILRDVLAMGAQPIALADPLHFGPLDYPLDKLSKGTRHPKYLFGGVVAGIRDYGNRVGIPTVAGCIVFEEGYLGNVVVNVACVGFAKKSQLVRNRATSVRDVFSLV